jgi:hypothetical protein
LLLWSFVGFLKALFIFSGSASQGRHRWKGCHFIGVRLLCRRFFSLFDANKLHWTTIVANLSFTGYIGISFVLAAFAVVESPATGR